MALKKLYQWELDQESDLYASAEWQSYARTLVKQITGRGDLFLYSEFAPRTTEVAYTDGNMIYHNAANCVAGHFSSMKLRVLTNIGVILHECAHIRYLDFKASTIASNTIREGCFWPEKPVGSNLEEQANIEEMAEAMQKYPRFFASMMGRLENCVADAHDEEVLMSDFGSFVTHAIHAARASLRSTALNVETLLEVEKSAFAILAEMLLFFLRFNSTTVLEEETWDREVCQAFLKIRPVLISARNADTMQERYRELNRIMVAIWPVIRDEIKKLEEQARQPSMSGSSDPETESGSSGGIDASDFASDSENDTASENESESGMDSDAGENTADSCKESGSDSTAESGSDGEESADSSAEPLTEEEAESVLKQLMDALERAERSAGVNAQKEMESGSMEQGENGADSSAEAELSRMDDLRDCEESADQAAASIQRSMERNSSGEKSEQDIAREVIEGIVPYRKGIHAGISLITERILDEPTETDKGRYQEIYQRVRLASSILQRQLRNELEELADDDVEYRQWGQVCDATRAYRKDRAYWGNQTAPGDIPSMAVAILVDESGSMAWGEDDRPRIDYCIDAAVMLEDFCRGMEIPCMITGHSTDGRGTLLNIYATFDRIGRKDRYRLTKMQARCNNRDGQALNAVAQLLAKRNEDVKMLFIISDGQPADYGYNGEEAKADLVYQCQEAEKQGILVFAAGIGTDKPALKAIYDDRFIDIQNLKNLPKILAGEISRKLLDF